MINDIYYQLFKTVFFCFFQTDPLTGFVVEVIGALELEMGHFGGQKLGFDDGNFVPVSRYAVQLVQNVKYGRSQEKIVKEGVLYFVIDIFIC